MSDDEVERLRRHLRALASVNEQLHAQLESTNTSGPRSGVGTAWVNDLGEHAVGGGAYMARLPDGATYLVEGGRRRPLRSGILAVALEQVLGEPHRLAEGALDSFGESAPVEVLEGPSGAPFVVIDGRRLPLRGLPLPHPVGSAEMQAFPQGPELDVGAVSRPGARRPHAEAAFLPLPTFLIIGAQKAATRWLRLNLSRHPEVFMAPGEPAFFSNEDRYRNRGVEWYREQFAGWAGEPIVGESTPAYLMHHHHPELVAARMAETVPDIRLVAILRDPVERAVSAVVHHVVKERLPEGSDLMALVSAGDPAEDPLGLISGGWYGANLQPFIETFGDQLLVVLHDDVAETPDGVFAKVLAHIGADPGFVPPEIDKVRFSNAEAAGGWRPALSFEDRIELFTYFQDDLARLEDVLGISLVDRWRPVADDSSSSVVDLDAVDADEPPERADGVGSSGEPEPAGDSGGEARSDSPSPAGAS